MSELATAMRFLRAAREDEQLASRLRELDPAEGLDPVIGVAMAAGYAIDAPTLRTAYRFDWTLRRSRYVDTR
jgi:hypothetical protein